MSVTGKQTKYGMESFFLVPSKRLEMLVPKGLPLYTRFGYGSISVGAWYHSNAYVDEKSYGEVLEAWVSVEIAHGGKPYALPLVTYNNSRAYSVPVNTTFRFTKEYAELIWKEAAGRHVLEVRKDNQLVLSFSGRPAYIPMPVPYSRPRSCWLIKDNDTYIAEIDMIPARSRIAFTAIEIPDDSPLSRVATLLKAPLKFSVFFNDAALRIPEPARITGTG